MDRTLQHLDRAQMEKPTKKKIMDLVIQIRTQKALQLIEKLKEITGAETIILRFAQGSEKVIQ